MRNVTTTGKGRGTNALFPRLLEYTLTVNRASLSAPGYYPIDDCKIPSTLCSFTLHLGANLPSLLVEPTWTQIEALSQREVV